MFKLMVSQLLILLVLGVSLKSHFIFILDIHTFSLFLKTENNLIFEDEKHGSFMFLVLVGLK